MCIRLLLCVHTSQVFEGLERVVIVSNRKTHNGGSKEVGKTGQAGQRYHVCTALVNAMRERLRRLLGPRGPTIEISREESVLEDLNCATSAQALVVASWGTSFGHWAGLLSRGCRVVMPQLEGISAISDDKSGNVHERSPTVGSKHLEPIAWRDGLQYVRARRSQWVHVPDVNQSVFLSPTQALVLLDD